MCSVVYFMVQATAPFPHVDAEFEVGVDVGVGDHMPGEWALGKAVTGGLPCLRVRARRSRP
jgi:hypothetical protein